MILTLTECEVKLLHLFILLSKYEIQKKFIHCKTTLRDLLFQF